MAGLLAGSAGCIDSPRFSLTRGEGAGSDAGPPDAPAVTVPDDRSDDMVLVPATTLADGVASPQNKPDDKGDQGKGKGKDAGAGAEPPPASHLVQAFWIDAREVSAAAYAECVASGACDDPMPLIGCTPGLDAHPIDCVTLDDARAYCDWRGKRLVTNDEFTAAAAGAVGRAYPWGAQAPSAELLDACGAECSAHGMYAASDGHPRTAPCGSFPAGATPEGIYDLAGNVAEWVEAGSASITRGGSYDDVDVTAVASLAMRSVPSGSASATIGFRCARDP